MINYNAAPHERCILKCISTILILLIVCSTVLAGDTLRSEIVRVIPLIQAKKYQDAIQLYQSLLKSGKLATWQQSCVYADLSYLYLITRQQELAFNAIDKAVSLGYDDFILVQQLPEYKAILNQPRFKAAYAKMRISPADMAELYWLKSETQSITHDMTMMITENTGRKDNGYTEVPQSQIPTRSTTSVGVLTNRMVVDILQEMQRDTVRESDIGRINHLIQMDIISKSGGGESYQAQANHTQEFNESLRQAQQRAAQRKQAVQQRRFVAPVGASNAQSPVPPLGSIK